MENSVQIGIIKPVFFLIFNFYSWDKDHLFDVILM